MKLKIKNICSLLFTSLLLVTASSVHSTEVNLQIHAQPDHNYGTDTLTDGIGFWVPEGTAVEDLVVVSGDNSPLWLTITESSPGTWILSGTPTESSATSYSFRLRISDAIAGTNRIVKLNVNLP